MALIKGHVVDADRLPVPLAIIYVVSSPQPMPDVAQLSGPDGEFVLGVTAPGTYVIGARSDEKGRGEASVSVESAQTGQIEIQLARD